MISEDKVVLVKSSLEEKNLKSKKIIHFFQKIFYFMKYFLILKKIVFYGNILEIVFVIL